jgi:hypothetical protein
MLKDYSIVPQSVPKSIANAPACVLRPRVPQLNWSGQRISESLALFNRLSRLDLHVPPCPALHDVGDGRRVGSRCGCARWDSSMMLSTTPGGRSWPTSGVMLNPFRGRDCLCAVGCQLSVPFNNMSAGPLTERDRFGCQTRSLSIVLHHECRHIPPRHLESPSPSLRVAA